MKRSLIALGLTLVTMLVFTGCGPSEANKVQPPETKLAEEKVQEEAPVQVQDHIVVAVPQDPDYLDPHLAAASGTDEMMFNVFEGLVKSDSEGKLIPAVSSEYKVSEEGLKYTFTLREGIKFHNGKEVTIEDVAYSYKRIKGDVREDIVSAAFENVEIDVIDDKTIEFTLKEVNSGFIINLTKAVIPSDMGEEEHNKHPIGTGPYKFVEYIPSQKVVLEKFDAYWIEGVPKIKNVEFRIFADNSTALMSLLAGEVDMYPRLGTENIEMLTDDFYYIQGKQNMVQLMSMNNKVKPLNDVNVRKAINYAIDVDMIIKAVADGKGTKLGSNMSPAMAYYYQEGLENTYNIDIEKAKALLKAAGYENGFDITIKVPSNYEFHVNTAEVIAEQLKAVNINVTIEAIEWSVWLEEVYAGRDYEMTIIGLTGKLDPHNILVRYESQYDRNFMNYSNEAYDKLIAEALTETDEDKRAFLYKEAQKILTEEVPAVYIMDPDFIVALKHNLKGYKLYPIYVQDLSNLYFE
ncbi:ABC transporter substrate-binding protein [Fusibacter sp. 3D3]|uniref:ABC transporter substrate-binding protein n=1 Tax=Fusibacter sp. 3D3 TaxID=1048380 RepID=UPI0008536D3F|nr:ABC transporter substrate-binding protein [Fusibacter sp. 3D3]GAU79480.1 dipeptide-binding ABC transporter, periplasmic substrate-binding component [Fusibacter sp. 3D3]